MTVAIQHLTPLSPEWHAARRLTIGSSDVATLFGVGFLSEFELWHQKRGTLDSVGADCDRKHWGRMLERAIAEGACQREGWQLIEPTGVYSHPDFPGMAATPDFFAQPPSGAAIVLEVKNVDYVEWKRSWTDDEPPLKYILQLQHQLACTGQRRGVIVALVGGNDLRLYPYERDERVIAMIKDAVADFWRRVRKGIEPTIGETSTTLLASVDAVYPARDAVVDLSADNELPELCSCFIAARDARLAAQKAEDAAKAEIRRKGQGATRILCPGFAVSQNVIEIHKKAQPERVEHQTRFSIKEIFA